MRQSTRRNKGRKPIMIADSIQVAKDFDGYSYYAATTA